MDVKMALSRSATVAVDMTTTDRLDQALKIVHYVSPAVVIAYYLLAVTVSICVLHNLTPSHTSPRRVLLGLMATVLFSYVVEACMLLIDTLANHGRFSTTDGNVRMIPA